MYFVPLCFHCSFGSFIPIFCLYSHNSVIFVIGISSMRFNEGSVLISSQMLACKKSLGSSYFGAWADFHWNHWRSVGTLGGSSLDGARVRRRRKTSEASLSPEAQEVLRSKTESLNIHMFLCLDMECQFKEIITKKLIKHRLFLLITA